MTAAIEPLPATRDLVAIAERASLFALLQQAMQRQHRPQQLPRGLYGDLNIPQDARPDPGHRFR